MYNRAIIRTVWGSRDNTMLSSFCRMSSKTIIIIVVFALEVLY